MKNSRLAIIVVVLALSLSACSDNSPKGTAEKFLNAFYHMEYDKARQVSTEKTVELVNLMEQFAMQSPDSTRQNARMIKVEIINVQEEGDNAVVTYTTSNEPGEQKLKLVKQNGKWLVNDSKQDAVYEEEQSETPPATDESAPADNDTTAKPAM